MAAACFRGCLAGERNPAGEHAALSDPAPAQLDNQLIVSLEVVGRERNVLGIADAKQLAVVPKLWDQLTPATERPHGDDRSMGPNRFADEVGDIP